MPLWAVFALVTTWLWQRWQVKRGMRAVKEKCTKEPLIAQCSFNRHVVWGKSPSKRKHPLVNMEGGFTTVHYDQHCILDGRDRFMFFCFVFFCIWKGIVLTITVSLHILGAQADHCISKCLTDSYSHRRLKSYLRHYIIHPPPPQITYYTKTTYGFF